MAQFVMSLLTGTEMQPNQLTETENAKRERTRIDLQQKLPGME